MSIPLERPIFSRREMSSSRHGMKSLTKKPIFPTERLTSPWKRVFNDFSRRVISPIFVLPPPVPSGGRWNLLQ